MNTVFKTYMQVWSLWSVAAGVALGRVGSLWSPVLADARDALAARLRGDAVEGDGGRRRDGDGGTRQVVGAMFVAALLLSTSLYGAFALGNHFARGHGPTLDAMEFTHRDHPDEAAAIEWLDDRPGQPHIASAPTREVYSWGNPASSLTGLPTIVGWGHEAIYRGNDAYEFRATDVRILYTGDHESRAAIIEKYDVQYVYVGPAERARYGNVSFTDEDGIHVAFQAGNVTIYEVDRSAL
jgi:uncharacterized membrane protein